MTNEQGIQHISLMIWAYRTFLYTPGRTGVMLIFLKDFWLNYGLKREFPQMVSLFLKWVSPDQIADHSYCGAPTVRFGIARTRVQCCNLAKMWRPCQVANGHFMLQKRENVTSIFKCLFARCPHIYESLRHACRRETADVCGLRPPTYEFNLCT